ITFSCESSANNLCEFWAKSLTRVLARCRCDQYRGIRSRALNLTPRTAPNLTKRHKFIPSHRFEHEARQINGTVTLLYHNLNVIYEHSVHSNKRGQPTDVRRAKAQEGKFTDAKGSSGYQHV